MNDFLTVLCLVLAGFLLAILLFRNVDVPLDSTDDHNTGTRSGMRVLIDHGTGLQYLNTWGGGLTPRLDVDGKHMRATGREEL